MATILPHDQYSKALHRRKTKSERQKFRKKYDQGPKKKKGSGKDVANPFENELNAATKLEFGDEENQLVAKQKAIPSWFDQYEATRQAASDRVNQAFTDATNALQATSDSAAQKDAAERARVSQEMRDDAARRGAAVSTKNEDTAAAAQASRQNLLNTFRNHVTTTGANEKASWAEKQRIGAGNRLAAQKGAQNALTTLAQKKGAFKTKWLSDKQDSLSKQAAEAAAFGLDKQKLTLDQQQQAFNQWLQKQQLDVSKQNANTSEYSAHKPPASGGGSGGSGGSGTKKTGPTQSQAAANQDTWDNVYAWVQQNPNKSKIPKKGAPSFIKNNPRYFAVARHVYGHKGKAKNPGDRRFLRRKGIEL